MNILAFNLILGYPQVVKLFTHYYRNHTAFFFHFLFRVCPDSVHFNYTNCRSPTIHAVYYLLSTNTWWGKTSGRFTESPVWGSSPSRWEEYPYIWDQEVQSRYHCSTGFSPLCLYSVQAPSPWDDPTHMLDWPLLLSWIFLEITPFLEITRCAQYPAVCFPEDSLFC